MGEQDLENTLTSLEKAENVENVGGAVRIGELLHPGVLGRVRLEDPAPPLQAPKAAEAED